MNFSNSKTTNEEILSVIAREKDAVETGNASEYFSVLADDAVFMPPNSNPKEGTTLREWLKDFVENFITVWEKLESLEVVAVNDLAYHVYNYKWNVTPRNGGQTVTGYGKGMHILCRQKDSGWKITREIWNANPPVE